ncbi:MAG: hypothetical protein ACI9U6_002567 [Loktanella salsilacus]|jgi:hypothetical protein|uniref:hypothetical protein n=1 Tax=Loktanella salsilacus TaxID=195913 RepID=UPI003988D372|tara:strand:+ start:783 stop:1025 length:243 start_codon:yes stop_codon:yes gene_type:complete
MTNAYASSAMMESSDTKASMLAAIARIESIPAGKTLIDSISLDDWTDASVAEWKIEVGHECVGNFAEELDDCDIEAVNVA